MSSQTLNDKKTLKRIPAVVFLLPVLVGIGTATSVNAQQYKKDTRGVFQHILDGNLDQAENSAKEIRDRRSEEPEPYFLLALIAANQGRTHTANQRLSKALDLGLPVGRLIAGPREESKSLSTLDAYREAIQSFHADNPDGILHGPMLGSAKNSVHDPPGIWVRTVQERPVRVVLQKQGEKRTIHTTDPVHTRASRDYTAVIPMRNLEPGTTYKYGIYGRENLPDEPSFPHSFRTFPERGEPDQFSLVFGGCSGFVPWNENVWNTISKQNPLALMLLGDNIYSDRPTYPKLQRYLYYRRQSRPEWRQLVSTTRVFSTWDDHDFKDNDSSGGPFRFSPGWKPRNWTIFRANWANPSYGGGSNRPGVWYDTHIADVHFIWLDTRYYRSNGNATMLGPVQKRWVKRTLKQSDATFKVVVSSVSFDYRAKDSDDTWNGFKAERTELFRFIRDNQIEGVVLMTSDRHRSDAWKIDEDNGKPEGLYDLYEFNSGRLTNQHVHNERNSALFSYNDTHSFGRVDVNTSAPDPMIRYTIINIDGEEVYDLTIRRSQLEFN